jgi:hypothetical protein
MPRGRESWGGAPAGGAQRGAGPAPARGAVRRDREPGVDLGRLRVGILGERRLGADDPAVLDQRRSSVGRLHHPHSGLLRVFQQEVVEAQPRHHQPVVRPGLELGPWEIDRDVLRMHAQADDPLEARIARVHAHAFHGADASRSEAVSANLLAREAGLVDGGDVDAVTSEVVSGGRSTWAGAHDQDVGVDPLGHARLPSGAPSGARETFHKQPSTGSGAGQPAVQPQGSPPRINRGPRRR